LNLGNQTVVLVSVSTNLAIRDENGQPAKVETTTDIRRVRFRQVTSTEDTTDNGDRVREEWRLTAPPVAELRTATTRDLLRYDGVTFQISGTPRVVRDMDGSPHHVSVTAVRTLG
jgi:hypothetical protein